MSNLKKYDINENKVGRWSDLEAESFLRSLKNKKWLNSKELAVHLSTTPGVIRNWKYLGKLPSKRFGRLLRFDRELIDRLLESGRLSKGERNDD